MEPFVGNDGEVLVMIQVVRDHNKGEALSIHPGTSCEYAHLRTSKINEHEELLDENNWNFSISPRICTKLPCIAH